MLNTVPTAAVLALALLMSSIIGACSSVSADTPMPEPVLSEAEIQYLQAEAAAYAKNHILAWPDVDRYVEGYAEDVAFADPTWGDLHRSGREEIVAMQRQWEAQTNFTNEVTDIYVSVDGAAYEEVWPGLQPPMVLPPDPPVAGGLVVFGFRAGETVSEEMWYPDTDNVAYGIGCFAVDGCPALAEAVDRYLEAWTSGDSGAVAALYSEDAILVDSILGLEADGASAIGDLAATRFGSVKSLSLDVLDLYAWTDGISPPSEADPEVGSLAGVAIAYRAESGTGDESEAREGIVALELATRGKGTIDTDPDGLIHREVVYHRASTLLAEPEV